MYKSQLSDQKYSVLRLITELGRIVFLAAVAVYMLNGVDGLGTVMISVFFLLTLLSAAFVLIGLAALHVNLI